MPATFTTSERGAVEAFRRELERARPFAESAIIQGIDSDNEVHILELIQAFAGQELPCDEASTDIAVHVTESAYMLGIAVGLQLRGFGGAR